MPKPQNEQQIPLNHLIRKNYYDRLKLMALAIFKWEGLEEIGCNARFLEHVLFDDGKACIVRDPNLGFLSLRVNPYDQFNVYDEPVGIYAYSKGYHKQYSMDDVIYIRNNSIEMPTQHLAKIFAQRLYDIEMVKRINLNGLKTPVIVQGSVKQKQTLIQMFQKWEGNEPFIFGDSSFNLEDVMKVLDLKPTYYLDKLTLEKHEVLNEYLTSIGINNANTDKKERLIVSEVESNNEMINVYMNMFYLPRKKACDDFNKKYENEGFKIDVKINENAKELMQEFLKGNVIDESEENEETGGEE